MLFFLLAGIWNAILVFFNFMQLFNESTFVAAADALPTYISTTIVCFSIFWLLRRIKNLEETVNDLCGKVRKCDNDIKELQKSKKDK